MDFKQTESVIVKDTVDHITQVKTVSYPTLQTFDLDESSTEVVEYLEQSLVESKEYEIVAIKKETFGHVQ